MNPFDPPVSSWLGGLRPALVGLVLACASSLLPAPSPAAEAPSHAAEGAGGGGAAGAGTVAVAGGGGGGGGAGDRTAGRYRELAVEDPYLELHTGPGRGYPIFYIAERGERVEVLKRRTDWFEIRVRRGQLGWVPLEQLQRTLGEDGQPFETRRLDLEDYARRRWEVGALYGDFGGANLISAFGAFSLTANISFELSASQALGRFSDSKLANLDVVEMLYPERRFSPYFTLGMGQVTTKPKATLVAAEDRTDRAAHAGFGLRAYLTRRFVFRAEYKSYVIFTSRDDNEEIREWKAGFSFFL